MKKAHFMLLILTLVGYFIIPIQGAGTESDLIKTNVISYPIAVSGIVTDQDNSPLIGVNVLEEGTTNGASTDINGFFQLENVAEDAILIFSYVGYQRQEITVKGRTNIDVTMASDAQVLDELVVVGYGTVKKSDLTGSVERVDAEQFKNQSMTQLTDMLTGNVAGFNANQETSAAGGSTLEVRGATSLNAGTDPLVVLDGVIYNGSLRDINPNDIQSIDILKDASSAAVFGAKAANGVVLVTTTKGSTGKPVINFTSRLGINDITSNDYVSRGPEDYINYRKGFLTSQVQPHPDYYYDDPRDLSEGVSLEEWRSLTTNPLPNDLDEYLTTRLNFWDTEVRQYKAGNSIDWGKEVMRKGLRQDYNLSVSGGNENSKYFWSAGYLNNEGVIVGDDYSVIRSRLNVDFKITDWLDVGAYTQFALRDESSVPADFGRMYQQSPFGELYNEDGTLNWYPGEYTIIINPLLETFYRDRDRNINSLFSSIFANVKLPFGFQYKLSFQPRIQTIKDYNYWSPLTTQGGRDNENGLASRSDYQQVEWMIDQILTWNKTLGAHNFDFTFLHNVEENRASESYQSNSNFLPNPNLGFSGMQFGTNPVLETDDAILTGDALMARVNYSFDDRYLLTASIRRDGFSAFGNKNPRATFPALALAWKISDESFFNWDPMNYLKLRLSWGVNGNRDIGQYAALATLESRNYFNGRDLEIGLTTSTLENPNLVWEETASWNVGLDIQMDNGRYQLTADVYNTTTSNLLINRILPKLTGFTSITTNLGELNNKGFEVTFRSNNISSSNFDWSSNLNFSLNRNKIVSLFNETGTLTLAGNEYSGELPDIDNEWFPGHAIDEIWNYEITGIWQEEERDEAAKYNLEPGDYKSVDQDGDGTYQELEDKIFSGFREPRYRLGLRNDFRIFKNFTASIFLRADLGHEAAFSQINGLHSTFQSRSSAPFPYWTEQNRSNDWPRLSLNKAPYGGGIEIYKPRSYLRVQDITLDYNFKIQDGGAIQSLRLFGAVRNAFTFSKWPAWDPESLFNPMPKTYTFGINITL